MNNKIIAMDTQTHKVSLVGMPVLNKIMLNMVTQTKATLLSHLRTKEMLDNVEDDV